MYFNYEMKLEANKKTMIINEPHIGERKEYLKTHTIKEVSTLTKKVDK